jgi:NhaP-type Na+/H+ or K+/H+ antiporter
MSEDCGRAETRATELFVEHEFTVPFDMAPDLVIGLAIGLLMGFALGYGVRSFISYRRRQRARRRRMLG